MVTRVRQAIGNADTSLYPDTYILQSLNNHQRRIQLKYPFPQYCTTENITTVAGTATYTMTAHEILVLENVVNATSGYRYDLQRMDETDYDLWNRGADFQGQPTHYTIDQYHAATAMSDSFSLLLYPTPDAAYTITVRYARRLPEMVISPATNYSVLPSQFDEALIDFAIADAFMRLGEIQKAAAWGAVATGAEQEAYKSTHKPTEVAVSTGWAFRAGVK